MPNANQTEVEMPASEALELIGQVADDLDDPNTTVTLRGTFTIPAELARQLLAAQPGGKMVVVIV